MPEEKGGGPSMFETVKKHGEIIDTHEQIIEAHEKSIEELKSSYSKLEENDKKQTEKLDLLAGQMSNLVIQNSEIKSTILQSGQSQQDFVRDTLKNQWELIKARDESKESERNRTHEIKLSEQALKKNNNEKGWDLVGKLVMAGGLLYLIVERLLTT